MKILVLNVDALHLGYLGCYGSEGVPTSNLDTLAAEGVVFDRHFADGAGAPYRSAWTGRYGPPLVPDARAENVLHDLLQSRQITGHFQACADWRFVKTAAWATPLTRAERGLLWLDLPSLAPPWIVADEFLEPFFPPAAAEEEETLEPYLEPPIGFVNPDAIDLESVRNTYAAVVSAFDERIGAIIAELKRRGLYDELLLIVTADAGLALGEHGLIGPHRAWLHEEVVHVPLLMRLPGAAEAGRHVSALTQPIDLFATILDALDLPTPVTHGFSLLPLARGETEQVRAYACAAARSGDSEEWALRTSEWAGLLPMQVPQGDPPRPPRLYVKPDDRWEVNDVRQQQLDLAEGLERTLREFAAAVRHPGPLEAPSLPAPRAAD
jgi:arylsulfatase A-like enzyme